MIVKVHAPNKKAADMITSKLKETASELGLTLNLKKCGIYNNKEQLDLNFEEADEQNAPFLPIIREQYKYLGLHQLERDTPINTEIVVDQTLKHTEEILDSSLSNSQKVTLFNSSVAPAAVYITGNLYPNESRATSLKKCSDLDKNFRKLLVKKNLLGPTSTRVITYLPSTLGGLGMKSLKQETEIQFVNKAIYLQNHPDMTKTKEKFVRLRQAGWRNPITD